MGLPKGQQVDFEALEARRLQAAQLFEQGLSQAAVSRRLGVKSASVCRWHQAWLEGGAQALRQQAPAGRKPRLVASPGWSQAPAGRKPRLVASPGWSQAPAGRKRRLVASPGWSQAPANGDPVGTAGAGVGEGPAGAGLSQRAVDNGAHRETDPQAVRGALSPRACLAAVGAAGLDPAATSVAGAGARRSGHRPLATPALARKKGEPPDKEHGLSTWTKAGSLRSPVCGAPGRRKGRRRC